MKTKHAFTLAEVLITLGIIGVVAAMTMPVLINNYKKQVTVTQLKKAYTTLAQAFTMAQKDHGDISLWDFTPKDPENDDDTSLKNGLDSFAQTYLIPYLNVVTDCGSGASASQECFYTWYANDGTPINMSATNNSYRFILNNSNVILLVYDSGGGTYTIGAILMYVDINGKQPPNTISKDIFVMSLKASTNKFGMFGIDHNMTMDKLLNDSSYWACSQKGSSINTSIYCGLLIQMNGWQIPDGYPWL